MSILKKFSVGTIGAAALAVCALAVAAVPAYAQEGRREPPATLKVDNARAVPVVVFLELGAYDSRIGTVPPHSQSEFRLPVALRDGEKVTFTVHPEGGFDLTTPEGFTVHNGAPITLFVPLGDEGFVTKPPLEVIPNPGFDGPTLTVDNPSGHAVVAFVEKGEFDTRVGMVPARDSKTFALPPHLTDGGRESIDVFVHVEGGTDLASETFDLSPDAHLVVKVPS